MLPSSLIGLFRTSSYLLTRSQIAKGIHPAEETGFDFAESSVYSCPQKSMEEGGTGSESTQAAAWRTVLSVAVSPARR